MPNRDLTNSSYVIVLRTKNATERYHRDEAGWAKVSARGRTFRATAEQVLNHILPALAGIKPNVTITVEHHPVGPEHSTSHDQVPEGWHSGRMRGS